MHFCGYYCLNIILIVNSSRACKVIVNITRSEYYRALFCFYTWEPEKQLNIDEKDHEVMKFISKRLLNH